MTLVNVAGVFTLYAGGNTSNVLAVIHTNGIIGTSDAADHVLTLSQLEAETVEVVAEEGESDKAQRGLSWLLVDETEGRSYIISRDDSGFTVRNSSITDSTIGVDVTGDLDDDDILVGGWGADRLDGGRDDDASYLF